MMKGIKLYDWEDISEKLRDAPKDESQPPRPAFDFAAGAQDIFESIRRVYWQHVIPEDDIGLRPSDLITVHKLLETEARRQQDHEKAELVTEEERVIVNKWAFADRIQRMHGILDPVLDNSTIDAIIRALNIAVLAAGAAFSWYVGVLFAQNVLTVMKSSEAVKQD
jgi:hypothetical protein